MPIKQKTTFREWFILLAFGATASLLETIIVLMAASLVATLIWWLAGMDWFIALLFSYIGIRLILETLDVFGDLRGVRCPACKRRIKASRAVKCVDCGGRVELTGGRNSNPE